MSDTPGADVAPTVWIRAVADQSLLAAWVGAPDRLDRARAAVAIARELDNPALISAALSGCAALVVYDLSVDMLHEYLDEAADQARVSGDRNVLCEARLHQAIADHMCGELRSAREAFDECRDLSDALGNRSASRSCQIWLGNGLLMLGDVEEARRVLEPLAAARSAPGELFTTILANILLGRACAHQGQPSPARDCLVTALAAATNAGGFQEDLAHAISAEVALAAGDGAAAMVACERSWLHTVPDAVPSSNASTRRLRPCWRAVT